MTITQRLGDYMLLFLHQHHGWIMHGMLLDVSGKPRNLSKRSCLRRKMDLLFSLENQLEN